MEPKVVLITGASSGIGKICAEHLQRRGFRVYGASRTVPSEKAGYENIRLDVNDDTSVTAGINDILAREGRIDVVVNCAGFGIAGSVEDTSLDEAKSQLETNFFGVLRVCKAVLPVMRRQQSGLIINISSIAGVVSLPFQGFYSAGKFALEGMTEALRMEVKPYGVRVVLVEPGDFRTQFAANRKLTAESQNDSVYRERFGKALAIFEKEESNGANPQAIAQLIERLINKSNPKLRYSVGPAFQRIVPALKQILPHKLYERLFMKYYNVN
jgi:NAD(P)-dependent dehydrogenase (short-subunit alcohol dehydrogenase family)